MQSPQAQFHGPGAVQVLGFDWPEEMATIIGERNLLTAVATSLNETGA